MKRIAAIALFVAATFITAGSAFAQDKLVKATVPFNFTVGNKTLPSGTYTIYSSTTSPNVLNITSRDKDVHILTLGQPQNETAKADRLVFRRYGNQYFLSDIQSGDYSMNIHFAATRAEKKLRSQVEEAGLFVNDPVLIALNQ